MTFPGREGALPEHRASGAMAKEQTRNTEVQINEVEIGKLPEKEFRIMIVKMIKNLENRMEKNASINLKRPRRIKE